MKNLLRRLSASLVLAVGVLSLSAAPSQAQWTSPPFPPPPPMVDLDVPVIMQENMVWCWLAVSEMAIRYRNFGNSLKQCEMLEVGYGLQPGTCCNDTSRCSKPAYGMQEVAALIQRVGGVTTVMTPPQDPMTLYNELRAGRPVAAQLRTGITTTHVVMIRGMRVERRFVTLPDGNMVYYDTPYLRINDPLSYYSLDYVPYSNILSIWVDSLVILPKPPKSRKSSSFCDALNKVLDDLPNMEHVAGEPVSENHPERREGKIAFQDTHRCVVREGSGDRTARYTCDLPQEKEEASECSALQDVATTMKKRIRTCLGSSWHYHTERLDDGSSEFTAVLREDEPTARVMLSLNHLTEESCYSVLDLDFRPY